MKRFVKKFKRSLARIPGLLKPKNELPTLLAQANPDAPLAVQVQWLEDVLRWVRSKSQARNEFDATTGQLHWVRLKFLFHLLERNPEWRPKVSATLKSILSQTQGVELFCRTGLTQESGVIGEIVDRLLRKIIPAPPNENSLEDIFPRLFPSHEDSVWVQNLPEEVALQVAELCGMNSETAGKIQLRNSILQAVLILSEEVASRGLSHDVRSRLSFNSVQESPFFEIRREIENFCDRMNENPNARVPDLTEHLNACNQAIDQIYKHLDQKGVSLALVYSLECQRTSLQRIDLLIATLRPSDFRTRNIVSFLSALIEDSLATRGIKKLLSNNFRLLSQKIVERAAASGEHYITRNREEYRHMFIAGLGGGIFTAVVTTLIKFAITAAHFAPFWEGFFTSLNYGLSFVCLQLFHFTLATKQPAMTGPALASKLKEIRGKKGRTAFIQEVSQLTRSQFAAVLGNIGGAIPTAFLIDFVWKASYGSHILGEEKAHSVLVSTNPFVTFTIIYAAWTGVILWSSGIISGWVENWVVYRELPKAIEQHRILNRLIGKKRSAGISRWFLHSIGGISSSLWLGMLMGFTAVFGAFFGFPADVRHVTLASASFAFAAGAVPYPPYPWNDLLLAAFGILVILVLNFGISFGLAFIIATRARNVRLKMVLVLIRRVLRALRESPLSFLLPG